MFDTFSASIYGCFFGCIFSDFEQKLLPNGFPRLGLFAALGLPSAAQDPPARGTRELEGMILFWPHGEGPPGRLFAKADMILPEKSYAF